VQQHPALVGRNALTRRAIRWERALVIRARGCRLAPRTVHGLGEPLGAGLLPVRHDHTGLDAWGPACDRDDHAARAPPRAGLGTRRVEAGALAPSALRGPCGLRDHGARQGLQDGRAGHTGALPEGGVGLDPRHHLRGGPVAVTTQAHQGVGPRGPQPLAQALPPRQPRRAGAARGLKDRGAQAPCAARRPGPRQAARAALIALVTGLGLRAMDGGRGVIDVKDDALGWAGVRGATGLHQHACQAGERGACDVVCAPRARRL